MKNYWDSEEVFLDGDQYFERLLKDIDQAQELITVEMYIFNHDQFGMKVARHLIQAHNRGVKVQIMVDGVGTYGFYDNLGPLFKSAGIKVKVYHPLPFYHPFYGKLVLKKKIQLFIQRILLLNRRNHRKIITIDQNIMYLGSFNFTSEHTSYYHSHKWKDMGARVSGRNVELAVLFFKKNWQLREYFHYRKKINYQKSRSIRHSPLRLNYSLFIRRLYYKELIKKLDNAKEKIWLMTPYFIPTRQLIISLGRAAERGVDVRILISAKTDVAFFQSLQFFYYSYLIHKGVKIFQYVETILHAKTFVIDDWITVGSSNLNHRSFLHDLEVDLSIQDENNKEIIMKDFIVSTYPAVKITFEYLKERTLWDRFLCRVFFIFKYWF